MDAQRPPDILDRSGYVIEVEDIFDRPDLDPSLWIPHYLSHWSSRSASAARFSLDNAVLRLRIDADQPPWCPDGAEPASPAERYPKEFLVDWFRAWRRTATRAEGDRPT